MLRYVIVDPTGNVTALVESAVEVELQPRTAKRIMERHPKVEQVGFVQYEPASMNGLTPKTAPQVSLRMAGGEFCGNATMSAAFLYAVRHGLFQRGSNHSFVVRASGVSSPLFTRLAPSSSNAAHTSIRMPNALAIDKEPLQFGQTSAKVPVVFMPGISHVIIDADSPFFELKRDPEAAEEAARVWCKALGACGLGLMFLHSIDSALTLTPLVYIPDADTMYWENSCASGSSAVGMYLAWSSHFPVNAGLVQPGGTLTVESDPTNQTTWLHGQVRMVGEYSL